MNEQEAINRGARARALLDDEMLTGALRQIEDSALKAWKVTAARDVEGREMAWLTVRAVDLLRRELQQILDAGKIAQRELNG